MENEDKNQEIQDSLESQETQDSQELETTPKRDLDKEWAEALQMNYETEWRSEESQQPSAPLLPPMPQEQPSAPVPPPIPQAPVPPAIPANPAGHSEPMPPTYLVWAVLATLFCCLVPGVVAVYYSSIVSSRYYVKDYEGARRASERAEWWIIASIVLGVVSATITLPLMIAGGF